MHFLNFQFNFLIVFCTFYINCKAENCTNDWDEFESKCFKFHSDKSYVTFYEAHTVCRDFYNATLVSIHSKNEQLFLTKLVFSKYNANNHVWIGARRTSNTTFEWEDNSVFDFVYWASGQPNNLDNKHYCASLLYTPNSAELGKWYDDPCSDRYFALCQRYAQNQVEIQEKSHLIHIKNDSFQVQTENSSFGALIDRKSSENQIKKEKGNFAATILSVVVIIQFIIITLLILLLIKRQSILPPYRTLSMSECTRNSPMT